MTKLSKSTTDHEEIRKWAESRGGRPARAAGTESKRGVGVLRIHFPTSRAKAHLEDISWDEFFEQFDKNGLAMVYQDKTSNGRTSRFSKLVDKSTIEERAAEKRSNGHSSSHARARRSA